MSAPQVNVFGDIVYELSDEEVSCAIEGATFHVAIAPNAKLEIQARVASAVYPLQRPVTKRAFYAAAMDAEDAFWKTEAWPIDHENLWIQVVQRMWRVVRSTQLVVS